MKQQTLSSRNADAAAAIIENYVDLRNFIAGLN